MKQNKSQTGREGVLNNITEIPSRMCKGPQSNKSNRHFTEKGIYYK